MNYFSINGVERPSPVESTHEFLDLIQYIQRNLVTDSTLVSSIRVNGIEIGVTEEEELGHVPLADIESVEVTLSHPRELVQDTLEALRPYVDQLAVLSRELADSLETTGEEREFPRLIDGLQTVSETITSVKMTLRLGLLQSVNVLEAELLSVLKDLLISVETGDKAYRISLLREHLPLNLEQWSQEGIPSLMRARDS